MSDSLKQDLIKSIGIDNYIRGCKQIDQMYDDIDRGIYSNITIDTEEELSLYFVQFAIENRGRIINKYVYALNEQDAKEIVFKSYKHYKFDKSDVYCKKVDITRGLMFNV